MQSCLGSLIVQVLEKDEALNLIERLTQSDLSNFAELKERKDLEWLVNQGIVQSHQGWYSLTELGYQLSIMIEDLIAWAED